MTTRLSVKRTALLACTALGLWTVTSASVHAADIPTGAPRSPLLNGTTPFSQRLVIYEEFGLQPLPNVYSGALLPVPATCDASPESSALDDFLKQPLSIAPRDESNTEDQNPWRAKVASCLNIKLPKSPIEGRPPGEFFAHPTLDDLPPPVYFQSATAGARTNTGLRDSAQRHGFSASTEFGPGGLYFDPAIGGTSKGVQPRLHPNLPVQNTNSLWTFDGTFPPKLLIARYGEPILFRHYNALPIRATANNGFGAAQMSTHFHNGHNPGESDGYPGAYFFSGQYYDYRWPLALLGHTKFNTTAEDRWAGGPDDDGGVKQVKGNFRETLSTLWFHDHRIDHTSENVYKGMAAMVNLYSAFDRGNEERGCHYDNPAENVNLCFPSGTRLNWGNRDYDVNLAIADKAWDARGQLYFNIFNTDGFLGDRMTVNWSFQPYLDVRPRRYRFRILNASVSRFFKIALVTATGKRVPFHMIANDGNIMEHAVKFPNPESQDLPLQGIGERFDIIVDFSAFVTGTRLYFVNLAEHKDGARPEQFAALGDALAGRSEDPAVGKFLEFRVAAARPGAVDLSMNPDEYVAGKRTMVKLPEFTPTELANARRRTFEFGRSSGTDEHPWTIKTDGGQGLTVNLKNVSALSTRGAVEIWRFTGGNGWTHPVHVHFTEGQILSRDGKPPPVWEKWSRKDMYNIGRLASGDMLVALRFDDFLGSYVEHCHNTTHEDKAMMLRFDVNKPDEPMLIQAPLPTWGGVYYADSYSRVD